MSTALEGSSGKLTKKQQKALKHRSGVRKGKGRANDADVVLEEVPEQDLLDDEDVTSAKREKTKKRKREDDGPAKGSDDEGSASPGEGEGEETPSGPISKTAKRRLQRQKASQTKKESDKKRTFIVFVGNLPYKCTTEDIVKHFEEACGEAPSVRLLTPKGQTSPDENTKPTTSQESAYAKRNDQTALAKSKGCAFLQFSTSTALQAALHLHESLFTASLTKSKRKINVELTAGGGGKSSARLSKLAENKERLEKQREKHRGEQEIEKEKKEAEKKKLREEWRKKQAEMDSSQPALKKARKEKPPRWLTGSNATKLS